jgi:hypothetical protein
VAPAGRGRRTPAPERDRWSGAGLEKRQRLENLLKRLQDPLARPDRRRQWRALTVLEQAGTPAARRLLEALSRGAAGTWLTREAEASLLRLDRRPK